MQKYEEMGNRVDSSYRQWSGLLEEYQVIDDKILGPKELEQEEKKTAAKSAELRVESAKKTDKKDGQIQVIYRPIIVADEAEGAPDLCAESLQGLVKKINGLLSNKDLQKLNGEAKSSKKQAERHDREATPKTPLASKLQQACSTLPPSTAKRPEGLQAYLDFQNAQS